MLSACSTISEPPIIINKTCVPPADFMVKREDLPKLNETTLTQKQILNQWIDDIQNYNNLNIDHTGLINWVNKYCK